MCLSISLFTKSSIIHKSRDGYVMSVTVHKNGYVMSFTHQLKVIGIKRQRGIKTDSDRDRQIK